MIVRNVVRSVVRNVVRSVVPSFLVQRYFTKLESALNSYYSPTSTPAITRLVMDVYPSNGNGNAGLPTGAPAVTDNVFQTIDFSFVGNLPDIGRNGAVYFDGYIGPVKAYNGTTLVGVWDMNGALGATQEENKADPSNPLIRQNIATEQVKLFDKVDDGWTGPELANNTLIPVDTLDAFTNLEVTSGLVFGVVYKTILEIANYSSGSLKINSTGTDSPFYSANGVYSLDVDDATSISAQTGAGGFTGSYRLSVKEFLEEV